MGKFISTMFGCHASQRDNVVGHASQRDNVVGHASQRDNVVGHASKLCVYFETQRARRAQGNADEIRVY